MKKLQYGTITFPAVKSTKSNSVHYVTIFYYERQGVHKSNRDQRWYTSALTTIRYDKLDESELSKISKKIKVFIEDYLPYDEIKKRLDRHTGAILNTFKNALSTLPLSDKALMEILSLPPLRKGKIALLSDGELNDVVTGVGAVGGAVAGAASWGNIPVSAIAGGATAGVTGSVLALGATSFAGGYAIGTVVNKGLDGFVGWATDGKSNSLGAWLYELTEDDSDSDSQSNSTSEEQGSTQDSSSQSSDDNEEEDASSSEDDSSSDTNEEASSSEDSDDDEDTNATDSTPVPDVLNPASTGLYMLYLSSKLGASALRQQLTAIDIMRGSALGIPISRDTLPIMLELDQFLGGFFLKALKKSVSVRITRYGGVIATTTVSPINVTAMTNFGLIDPNPLDMMFFGETTNTLGFVY